MSSIAIGAKSGFLTALASRSASLISRCSSRDSCNHRRRHSFPRSLASSLAFIAAVRLAVNLATWTQLTSACPDAVRSEGRVGTLSSMDRVAPVPPLLVAEGWDATFFRSQRDLGAYLEPWFVEEDYRAWDALGRSLELVVVERRCSGGLIQRLRSGNPLVEARLREPPDDSTEGCATYLREWLQQMGGPAMPEEASLSDLLVQALIRGDVRL